MEQESLDLARRVGMIGPSEIKQEMRVKLSSGVKEFDTILRKTNKVSKVFTLGRGRFGSVSESVLRHRNLLVSRNPITIDIINKLSPQKGVLLENRLYQLLKKGVLPLLSKEDPLLMKGKTLSDCIVMDESRERAYFMDISLEKMLSKLGRVLYYKGKIPAKFSQTSEYYMRDRIDTFSQEIRFLSLSVLNK